MDKKRIKLELILIIFGTPVLYFIGTQNYLLYHTLVEFISIFIAFALFSIGWNTKDFSSNSYLLFLGISLFFIGSLDLIHTLSYKGMNIFPGYDADLPTQLWIASRYLESFSIITASYFIKKKFNAKVLFNVYSLITIIIVATVFLRWFPVCYHEENGLTLFKKISEYLISILLIFALWRIHIQKQYFSAFTKRMIYLSIIFTILSEISFSLYINVYGLFNFIGHIFKLLSFYLIYKALVETSLKQPYELLFRELNNSEKQYHSLFDNMQNAFALHKIVTDENNLPVDYRFVDVNHSFEIQTGLGKENILGKKVTEVLPDIENEPAHWIERYGEVALKGTQIQFENYSQILGKWFSVVAYCPKLDYFATISEDITELKRTEEIIRLRDEKLNLAMTAAGEGIWEWDLQTNFVHFDDVALSMLGYTQTDIKGDLKKGDWWVENVHPDDKPLMEKKFDNYIKGKTDNYAAEFRLKTKEGSYKWISSHGRAISYTEHNDPKLVIGIHRDINENKIADERIKKLLQEKEILLKEVHHRIKNNMATIESLMNIQARRTSHIEVKKVLNEAKSRISSMRILYEKLFQSNNFQEVNAQKYFSPLIDELIEVFPEIDDVKIIKNIGDFTIETDMILPLGIIINELVTNVMKYAFRGKTDKELSISAQKVNDHFKLIVQDNGVGLQDDFDINNSNGFGLHLVKLLVNQLGAEFAVNNERGVEIIIEFDLNGRKNINE